eukprot:CAMPEP_0172171250 /NCGR_PEP_ID=MMETSP1050-20130122/11785_1 /TAXON_ID=233186 /ORGANISM="Cryptomonas curvata, Strain CCAP979/52" /LENGTH=104 /DNA_ID=CAMNT_0012842655 /DNA_START=130 /DNA_END=444 /DNA_ORIENTATION=-
MPFTTDQSLFDELQITDVEYKTKLPSSDISGAITKRSEMRRTDLDEMRNLLAFLTRQMSRPTIRVVTIDLASAAGNPMQPHTEMPPPTRFIRRSRAAGLRPAAN